MISIKNARRARALFAGACAMAALALAPAAQAAKVGPYFPLPNNLTPSGPTPREGLLKINANWLQNGLDNLKKARAKSDQELQKAKESGAKPEDVAKLEEKQKALDADIEATTKELEIANDATPGKEAQGERKRLLLLNIGEWLRELERQATQQMKIAILGDGMEAQSAQAQHGQLNEQADRLQRAMHDQSVEIWGN